MTADKSNAFVQREKPRHENDSKVVMKIRDPLVDMLADVNPNVYQNYVVNKGIQKMKVLHTQVNKALYIMLQSSLLSMGNNRQ